MPYKLQLCRPRVFTFGEVGVGIIIRISERYDQVKNRNDLNRKLIFLICTVTLLLNDAQSKIRARPTSHQVPDFRQYAI